MMSGLVSLKGYALAYVGTIIALASINVLLSYVGFSIPSGLSTVLPAMMGAMMEGQKHARGGFEPFTNAQAWAAARDMTYIVAVVTAVVFVAFFLVPSLRAMLIELHPILMLSMTIILILISFLTNRFFLIIGYTSQRKAMERQIGK